MRRASSLIVLICACACGGSVAHTETAKPKSKPQPAAPAAAATPAQPAAAPPAQGEVGADASAPPAPPAAAAAAATHIEGGDIPRPVLLAVLSRGIGRFLQHVHAEAHLIGGRFVGWRLLSLFDGDPNVQSGALQPGDTVMRVNGQSIERPEQFKNVWDSMATQSELMLLVQRAGKQTQVRYRIVDPR
jgi:S1-C subfamily serine protease